MSPCTSGSPVVKPDAEIHDNAYERLNKLTSELHRAGLVEEANELARCLDDLNNCFYSTHGKAEGADEDLESYEEIMEHAFTIVKVKNRNATGLHRWCLENLKADFHYLRKDRIAFTDADEAVLFKLTWGGS